MDIDMYVSTILALTPQMYMYFCIKYRWMACQTNELVWGMNLLLFVSYHSHIQIQGMYTVWGDTYGDINRPLNIVMGS